MQGQLPRHISLVYVVPLCQGDSKGRDRGAALAQAYLAAENVSEYHNFKC